MKRKNVPLNALRAFEAAARLGRQTGAAEELGVTHGAISRQVRQLEDYLGFPLFEGTRHNPVLTQAGKSLAPVLSDAFNGIEAAVRAITETEAGVLDVACLSTFAMRWLIPRLHHFYEAHPQTDVRLSTKDQKIDGPQRRVDLSILVIDTTTITVHDLRRRVTALYGEPGAQGVALHLCSFGFRHGIPPEADFVFDVRFLDNPYFVKELRGMSGLDAECAAFVHDQPLAGRMVTHVVDLVGEIMPAVDNEGRASLTVAIGCTGGRHRSVALIEAVQRRLAERGLAAQVQHRDINR